MNLPDRRTAPTWSRLAGATLLALLVAGIVGALLEGLTSLPPDPASAISLTIWFAGTVVLWRRVLRGRHPLD